jgi:archaellum component FlaG (FlaF/FlaG flagellin family)
MVIQLTEEFKTYLTFKFMKKTAFVFFLIGIVNLTAAQTAITDLNTQTKQEVKEQAAGGKGEMTFEKELHNFDTIEYAGNGTYEFKFKNTGTEPVIISNAQGSCGCTIPTYPKDIPIQAGETQVIKVTYDTKRPGTFTKTVTINSNAKEPVKIITIKGYVRNKVIEPTFSIDGQKSNGFVPLEKSLIK